MSRIFTFESKVIVFDIDGTVADLSARQQYVMSKPKNWKAFNAGILNDKPHQDIIFLCQMLHEVGCTIIFASGRSDDMREDTVKWLREIADIPEHYYEKLYMRKEGDFRNDDIIKKEILDQMRADGYDPFMVFDDRDRVVAMWRNNGVRCLQVAPGDF